MQSELRVSLLLCACAHGSKQACCGIGRCFEMGGSRSEFTQVFESQIMGGLQPPEPPDPPPPIPMPLNMCG